MKDKKSVIKMHQQKFGSAIRRQRLTEGLSQEELAHRAGLHRTYITDVERGARNPSLSSIKRLCDALEITLGELFALLERSESPLEQGGLPASERPNHRQPPVKILVVEEDPIGADSVSTTLKEYGIANEIQSARSAAEALDFLNQGSAKSTDARQTPEVVFLDLRVSKGQGLELARRIREHPAMKSIPLIALSPSSENDAARFQELGFSGILVKPFDFQKIVQVMQRVGLSWILVRGRK